MLLILLLYFSVFYDVVKVENNSYFYKKFTYSRTNLLHMKPLKLILAAVLGLAVVVSGYSVKQKKENKDKVVKGRVIQLPVYVTDIDKNPIMEARVHINNNNINAFYTNEMGVVTLICKNFDTLYIRKENYISQMIPIKNRYELNVVLEKIPEDLLPAKDSTEKK